MGEGTRYLEGKDLENLSIRASTVMLEFGAGRRVRAREWDDDEWSECVHPLWDWSRYEYETVPEPREWWANEHAPFNHLGPLFDTRDEALKASGNLSLNVVRLQEVIE